MSEYLALSINRGHTRLARRGASSTGKFVPALQWERLQSPEREIPGRTQAQDIGRERNRTSVGPTRVFAFLSTQIQAFIIPLFRSRLRPSAVSMIGEGHS
jgi:hypothetical protein